jgi:hypothetical protein
VTGEPEGEAAGGDAKTPLAGASPGFWCNWDTSGMGDAELGAGVAPGSAAMAIVTRQTAARRETWEVFIGFSADGLWFAMFSGEIKHSKRHD